MQCPFIHPYAYSTIIMLFTIVTTAAFILLLMLPFCYCYYYITVTTDKLLRASLFPGAAELTTHLLRLINILWLPLCRINKSGFYFPRILLQSPILVGHQKSKKWRTGIDSMRSLQSKAGSIVSIVEGGQGGLDREMAWILLATPLIHGGRPWRALPQVLTRGRSWSFG
jgi:hypothetical protein